MSGYTRGPWIITKGDEWTNSIHTEHDFGDWNVASINRRRDEADANIRLIASAPDLLEALELLYEEDIEVPRLSPHQRERLYAVINKATGEKP